MTLIARRRVMWTMLCQFKAGDMEKSMFVLKMGKSHPPLTPVCGDHPLAPHFPNEKEESELVAK
jgi:hypothetical protein